MEARFPFGGRHAVDDRAAGFLIHLARFRDPVAQTVAAKSREAHQVDVRRVAAMPEQADEVAERRGRDGIVAAVEGVVAGRLIVAAGQGFSFV